MHTDYIIKNGLNWLAWEIQVCECVENVSKRIFFFKSLILQLEPVKAGQNLYL